MSFTEETALITVWSHYKKETGVREENKDDILC